MVNTNPSYRLRVEYTGTCNGVQLQRPSHFRSPFSSSAQTTGRAASGTRNSQGATAGRGGVAFASYAGQPLGAGLEGSSSPRICILGGGFGGLYTAVRLESLMWPHSRRPQITLIDQNEQFVFKPLLYELINGGATPEEVAPMFADLLAPMNSTSFVQGSVHSVHSDNSTNGAHSSNTSGGTITLADGQRLQYDWLVLALGSSTSFFGIPGVKDLALPFNDFKDAMKVLRRVEDIETRLAGEPAGVVVVGAGYAGVELASTVAERLGRRAAVQLVSAGGDILEGMPPGQVKAARSMLQDLRVTIVTNAMVSSISEDQQQNLRVLKQQRVFALGDVAGSEIEAETANIPPTAQVAFQQADYVAWNLWSAINSRPLLPFKYQHLGDMMSLGRVNGAVTLPLPVSQQLASGLQSGPLSSLLGAAGISLQPDATGKGLTLQGPLAGFVRRAAYLYRQPTDQHKLRVGRDWLQQAAEEAQRMLSGSRPN
ncbi:hypothetical protein WJX79_005713 [Trebouxia sp. C0005]